MFRISSALTLALTSYAALAQAPGAAVQLPPQTTLPIVFTKTVTAKQAHVGDIVTAQTIQAVRLANGVTLPSGARIVGHVAESNGFVFDKTPYAKQKNSVLTVRFDSIESRGISAPLNVTVRAMADIFATNAAYEPKSTDLDPLGTRTLIGGDLLTPSQNEVQNRDGDTVGYNRRDGFYAHLIPNGHCDGSSTEASMGIYAASACGLYGYANVTASEFGSINKPSTLTLVSHRDSPEISKHSTALLEVLPQEQASVGR